MFEVSGDRAVLLDVAGTELITLNPVGTIVWQALDEPRDAPAVAAHLQERFPDVHVEQLEADAAAFLDELAAAGLVVADAAG